MYKKIIESSDQLAIFRHMVGIHSTRSFATSTTNTLPDLSHNNLHFDGRAAPNLGIYNRVVHREQAAKRGYKFSSWLINSCLGIQVIVAASLTAMGAANSNHVSITAFGAINTVIAGLLTYLKGSGLPNRIRYYENEWKKVREYIEQRERDFSRPDCRLDVHEVVRVIETMYEEVKADVQTNTPDNYISVSDIRNRASAMNPQVPKLAGTFPTLQDSRLKELEMKYGHKVADFLEGLAKKEQERLAGYEKDVERDIENGRAKAEREIEERKSRVVDGARDAEKEAERRGAEVIGGVRDFEREVERRANRISELGREAGREVERDAERQRSYLGRIGRDIEDEIHFHRRD